MPKDLQVTGVTTAPVEEIENFTPSTTKAGILQYDAESQPLSANNSFIGTTRRLFGKSSGLLKEQLLRKLGKMIFCCLPEATRCGTILENIAAVRVVRIAGDEHGEMAAHTTRNAKLSPRNSLRQ